MEIRRWHCYFVINCALIVPLLSAKSFSINEAIAAESNLQSSRTKPAITTETSTRVSLNKALASEPAHKSRKFKSSKHYSSPLTLGKFPLLKTKKFSEITSQLKPKSLSELFRPLYKRKRQSKKREIYKHDKIDEKYFPLFKNLGLLFDNLLHESGESYEFSKKKQKQRKYGSDEKRGVVCSCAVKSDTVPSATQSHKKTIITAKTLTLPSEPSSTFEKPITAATTTNSSLGNLGSFGQNKDVPLLLTRDTSSGRRDHNGHSERSRPAFHRDSERDIPRNSGNRKHSARNRKYEYSTEYDEEDTDSNSRNDASGDVSRRERNRGDTKFSHERYQTYEETFPKTKKARGHSRGHIYEHPRENKFKIRRNKTESEELLPKPVRGLRRTLSENQIGDIEESIQSDENYEESRIYVPLNNTSVKRIADESSAPSGEDQEVRPRDETVISINDLSNLSLALQEPRNKGPSVSIIDGYSVARDKNGQNKLTEKTIRIHV